ncbi:MAG: c-type cytochrome [bacterium]|jgi:mono/diheme cytochrome c family protein|nr:c-type cytochrome [bacterium]
MDFPIFHLDFFGNRFLIAFIAIVHVIINHSMAVGAAPLITLMEWWGYKKNDPEWDRLAHRILFVCFLVTTSIGALTGVGIWLTTSLVNPNAIGSLIRVFFWAWFTEWVVFVTEVCLILLYFLTWEKMKDRKLLHIGIGAFLSFFSWITMAIIVAILGYMMDIGSWSDAKSILSGILNPIYIPQLAFRTPWAMMSAGLFALLLTYFFTCRNSAIRPTAIRFISIWTLAWTPLTAAGALWYWKVVPTDLVPNVSVALLTQQYANYNNQMLWIILLFCLTQVLVCVWGMLKPHRLPRVALVIPFILALFMFGTFERVREFIRKPYIIYNYMYANGIRIQDYPLLQDQGVLKFATYVSSREITDENRLTAGREVFQISCTRCHTVNGVNSIIDKLQVMYGESPWDKEKVKLYINGMHNARPYMPPFPGNEVELDAMVDYLLTLQRYPEPLPGAQTVGVVLPGKPTPQ